MLIVKLIYIYHSFNYLRYINTMNIHCKMERIANISSLYRGQRPHKFEEKMLTFQALAWDNEDQNINGDYFLFKDCQNDEYYLFRFEKKIKKINDLLILLNNLSSKNKIKS